MAATNCWFTSIEIGSILEKGIILKLAEYGELNQSRLMSYCGLNNVKHKSIVDELVEKGLIIRIEEPWAPRR